MSRALSLRVHPADHVDQAAQVETYTYSYHTDFRRMSETVYLCTSVELAQISFRLTPDEATELAHQLLAVATQCREHRDRRQSLEDIENQLRDPDFDASLVRFAHPDVVYCRPGEIEATSAAHPGKLVIAHLDEADDASDAKGAALAHYTEQAALAEGARA